MHRTGLTTRYWLATLALGTLIWVAPAGAQTQSAIPQQKDSDTTQRELANMDSFMESHPEIAEQVRKNPSLVNNEEFVEDHPALQQFFAQHPELAALAHIDADTWFFATPAPLYAELAAVAAPQSMRRPGRLQREQVTMRIS